MPVERWERVHGAGITGCDGMTEQQDKPPKRCEELYYHMSKKEALLIQNFLYSHQVIDLPGWKDAENAYQLILSRTYLSATKTHNPSGTSPICEKCTSGAGPFCSGCYHLHQLPQYVPWSELRMIEALEHIAGTGSMDAINAYLTECRKQIEEKSKGVKKP